MKNVPITSEGAKAIAVAIILLCGMTCVSSLMQHVANADTEQATTETPNEGKFLIRRDAFVYVDERTTHLVDSESFCRLRWTQRDGTAGVIYTLGGNFLVQISREQFIEEYTRSIQYQDAHAGNLPMLTLDDLTASE